MKQDDPQQYIVIVVKGSENSLKLWLFYPQHSPSDVGEPNCSEQLN